MRASDKESATAGCAANDIRSVEPFAPRAGRFRMRAIVLPLLICVRALTCRSFVSTMVSSLCKAGCVTSMLCFIGLGWTRAVLDAIAARNRGAKRGGLRLRSSSKLGKVGAERECACKVAASAVCSECSLPAGGDAKCGGDLSGDSRMRAVLNTVLRPVLLGSTGDE